MEGLESKLIAFMRFPLIIGVVFIHAFGDLTMNGVTSGALSQFPINDSIQYIISRIIAGTCVPAFLFIAGYLFFLNSNTSYVQKIKKRAKTLLVPYLFWNGLILLLYAIVQRIPPIATLFSGNHKLICDYSAIDYIKAFWALEESDPIVGPLWFVRNLMVLCLLTPIIKVYITYLKKFGIYILGAIWLFKLPIGIGFPGFNETSLFFFAFGAYYSIHKESFVSFFNSFYSLIYYIYPVFVVLVFVTQQLEINSYLSKLCILLGIIFFFRLLQLLVEKRNWDKVPNIWNASFFIFLAHEPFQRLFRKVLFKIIVPNSEQMLIALYFFAPIFVICTLCLVYKCLSRKTPRLLAFITGGRA